MISPSEYSQVMRPRKVVGTAFVVLFWMLVLSICITLAPRDNFPRVPPAPPMPSPNAVDVFHNAAMLLQNSSAAGVIPTGTKAPPIPMPKLRAAVRANQKAITEFRRALSMPCQYPTSRNPNDPLLLRLEEVSLGQFIVQEGKVHEADRSWRAAADSYLDIYEFGIKMATHSSLLNGLIGTLLQAIATEPLGSLLDRCDPATAAHISDRLTPLYALRRPSFDLLQEEWFADICHLRVPIHTHRWRDSFDHILYCHTLHLQQKYWEAQIAWAKTSPCLRGSYPGYEVQSKGLVSRLTWEHLAALALPLYRSAVEDTDKRQTETQLVLVKAKLIAYHGQHNFYPAVLTALSLSPELRTDPYSNRPLIYLPPSTTSKVGKMKLYSVGLNHVDDGSSKDDLLPGSLH